MTIYKVMTYKRGANETEIISLPPFLPEPWPPVLTADEAAGILRRSKKTVQRYVARGLIKGIEAPGPYLISSEALRAFIRGDKEPQR